MNWSDQSTADRIVTIFAITIASLLVIDVLAMIVLTITQPNADLDVFVIISGEIIAMMLGALVGYIGGSRSEQ